MHPRKFIQGIAIGVAAGLLGGCASFSSIPLGALYTNVRTPLQYRSATAIDVQAEKTDPTVTSRACHRTILYLISWGDNGYVRAVRDATKTDPIAILYDVRVDTNQRSLLLGLYEDECTILAARLGHAK